MDIRKWSLITPAILCLSWFALGVAKSAPPHFTTSTDERSVCAPKFSDRVTAADPDGDQVAYQLVASSSAAMDYSIDTGSGMINSRRYSSSSITKSTHGIAILGRPFSAGEKSILSVEAVDPEGHSSACTLTITYTDCGSRIAEPESTAEARLLEPLELANASARAVLPTEHRRTRALLLQPSSSILTLRQLGILAPVRPPPSNNILNLRCQEVTAGKSGTVRTGRRVGAVEASGGRGPYRFQSLDTRFNVRARGGAKADIHTSVPLPVGFYPFIVSVIDGRETSVDLFAKICVR